jgi:aminoglycoside phosphotransferase family enzyme/predicted kinase
MPPSLTDAERAQAPLIDWLQRQLEATTGAPVKRIDTQGAIVWLSGCEAWKFRRAIRLPFLDYSTPEKRRDAAQAEIRLNGDAAPGIYRDAIAITRDGAGYALDGAGEPVDWITRMRRFDEEATLDRLAERGELTPALIADLAEAIFASHARAAVRDPGPAVAALESWIAQNRAAFLEHEDLFPPAEVQRLDVATRAALERAKPLPHSRAEFCRRCHGDLHLGNIAVIDGKPAPFDAIEFDERIATGDVLYDLAFTLMDFWERGLREAANALMNAYLSRGPEAHFAGLAALPLFLSQRAAIRAKVEAANRSHLSGAARAAAGAAARRYFDFAQRFLIDEAARLVAVGGLSGSGKSALARALAPELGRAPGAVWLASDIERKHLLGVEPSDRLPVSAYDHETSARVYDRVRRRAGLALGAGHSAIVDMMHSWAAARSETAALATQCGVAFAGLWLEAPLDVRLARVSARRGDASDADAAVASAQRADPLAEPGWIALDASVSPEALTAQARGCLGGPHLDGPAGSAIAAQQR